MDQTWPPRVLAAPANGGANGGADEQSPQAQPAKPQRGKRVRESQPGHAGDWRTRGAVLRQRTAEWFKWTRQHLLHDMSLRELQAAAHADGVSLSVTSIQRIESLTNFELARERSWIAWDYVLWLAAYSGQSIADVDRFLTSGDWRHVGNLSDEAPTEESQADRVRANFRALSDKRKQEVVDFMIFARSLDDADDRARWGLRPLPTQSAATPSSEAPTQPKDQPERQKPPKGSRTQQVLSDTASGISEVRQELRELDEQQPGQEQDQGRYGRAKKHDQKLRADQS